MGADSAWLNLNDQRTLVCGKTEADPRTELFADYLLVMHLPRIKHQRIDLFNPKKSLEELQNVAGQIGLRVDWQSANRLAVTEQHL